MAVTKDEIANAALHARRALAKLKPATQPLHVARHYFDEWTEARNVLNRLCDEFEAENA